MKLPIRRIKNSVPPKFEYFQQINLPQGGTQMVRLEGVVSPSLEGPLCDLLNIAEQLAAENEQLRAKK